MNTLPLIFPILLFSFLRIQGQSNDRAAVTFTGDRHQQAGVGELSWAMGEIATETFQNGAVLTLGFFQGDLNLSEPVSVSPDLEGEISLFPNPTDGSVTIRFTQGHRFQLLLFDPLGKPLLREWISAPAHHIDLGSLPDGVYELKVRDERGAFLTTRIVKVASR